MNRLSRLLPAYRLCGNNIKLLQPQNLGLVRYQPRLNYAELPRIKRPGEGKGPITWKSVKIVAVGGAIMLGILKYMEAQKDAEKEKERRKTIGKAAIGGPWELMTTTGEVKKSSDFHGKWCLIYFGFTHCPDVCPDELEKMAGVVEDLEKEKISIQPLFITVDPERDTKEALEKYIKEFSSKLLGLTGTKQQIAEVCKKFRVYFSAGPRDKDDDYIVDHTIVLYLINPKGEFVDYFGQNKKRSEVTDEILLTIAKYNAKK